MQKKFPLIIASVLLLLIVISSCSKKNDEGGQTNKTKTDLIAKSSWKFSDARVSGVSVAAFLDACQKDNIITFQSNGNGTADEGASKCDPGDPATNPFTWSFQNNETVLFISTPLFTGGNSTFTIVDLTETQLVVSQMISVSGSSQNAEVTFVH